MAWYFSPALRRRLAPLVLGAGLLLLGHLAHTEMPRDQEVRFVLPPERLDVRAIRVTYLEQGESLSFVEFRPALSHARPRGTFVHQPSLRPGLYDMAIEVEDQGGRVHALSKPLTVPSDVVTIRLHAQPTP